MAIKSEELTLTTRIRTPDQKAEEAERQRRRRALFPERCREINRRSERKTKLLKVYGLTLNDYNLKLKQQGNCCAICKTTSSGKRDWHVDHCHSTGKVRGLLCHSCNLMLGHAKDNMNTLEKAIQYLKESLNDVSSCNP
jgi:hypothetical protein